VSGWRWPSWAMVGWTGLYLLVIVMLIQLYPEEGASEASYKTGQLFWVYLIGMVALGVAWRQTRPQPCPRCGLVVAHGTVACPQCGVNLIALAICPRCGQRVQQAATYCKHCGYQPPPPPPPPAAG
jgi:hypothetical protein